MSGRTPGNGNAEQRTANGTLIFRALDGRLLFSNDSQTWINGPDGLVDRPNNQRFPWEGDRQVIEALQRGGYLIYFRHGATDSSQTDSDPNNLANCATQRNLTDQGRAQARAIGEALRSLNIPLSKVLTSEYCRAKEYAQLSLGVGEVEPSLVLPDPLPPEVRQANTAAFQRLLAIPPPPGSNVVFVAHSPNIRDAAGVDLPVEGEAAILQPSPGEIPHAGRTHPAGRMDGARTSAQQSLVPVASWRVVLQRCARRRPGIPCAKCVRDGSGWPRNRG